MNNRATDADHVPCVIFYGISAYESNAMKSSNPHSGIYIAETARTLDNNGGNPACNQGGCLSLKDAIGLDLYNQATTGGGINDCDIKTV